MSEVDRESHSGLAMAKLFEPIILANLSLRNRLVMAPMTRHFAPSGIPSAGVAEYYAKRARGGVGMVITEASLIPHYDTLLYNDVPHLFGEAALDAWRAIVEAVHLENCTIAAQLWHIGRVQPPVLEGQEANRPPIRGIGPSGLPQDGGASPRPMTEGQIADVVQAFARAALNCREAGFDAIELHGGHGYLIDQFLWRDSNQRDDRWGGDVVGRTRFACAVVSACRAAVGPDFPIILRLSQWKQQDYSAKLARSPDELGKLLAPLAAAGVDIFHCSQRRFWEPEFAGSELSFAGWTKALTGRPVITVGSVGLDDEFLATSFTKTTTSNVSAIDGLLDRLAADEFDLVAVGRALVANPDWGNLVRGGHYERLRGFDRSQLRQLI